MRQFYTTNLYPKFLWSAKWNIDPTKFYASRWLPSATFLLYPGLEHVLKEWGISNNEV